MFNVIPIKIPMTYFSKIETSILQYIWKHKRPPIAKAILCQKSNTGSFTIPDFKLYYRAIVIKIAWDWHRNRHESQWNRIEDAATNSHNHSHLNFDKGAQNMHWRKDSLFNKWCLENCIFPCRKLKLDPVSLTLYKHQCKMDERPKAVRLIQGKIGNTMGHVSIGNYFMNGTLIPQQLRESMKKWDYMKVQSFCTAKEIVTRLKKA
jgi:hypothetical protein